MMIVILRIHIDEPPNRAVKTRDRNQNKPLPPVFVGIRVKNLTGKLVLGEFALDAFAGLGRQRRTRD